MGKKNPTPNYKLMFESAVYSLQVAYTEYKKAKQEELRWTFFDNKGQFSILAGYEERRKRVEKAEVEVARLMQLVKEYDVMKGGTE